MRIAEINTVGGVGSTGRIALSIAELVIASGNEAVVICGREKVSNPNVHIFQSKFEQFRHVARTRLFDLHGTGSVGQTKRIINYLRDYSPDIIHLHNIHGYYLNYILLFEFLKEYRKPVIWTLHDCWPFTGHCAYFDYIGCEKWKNGCIGLCSLKRTYPESVWISNCARNYQEKKDAFTQIDHLHIVTPSLWLEKLVKYSFLKDYQTHVIHNGIDLSIFRPVRSSFRERYGLKEKTLLLAVSDGWGPRKGLSDAIQIAERLTPKEKLIMVGFSGKEKVKIPDGIVTIPRTNSLQELVEVYSAADVFINPTFEDNYPTVNLEAQACGTPVITYNTGGSPESVPKENVVPKGDYIGLLNLARNYSTLKMRPAELFDKNKAFERYIELYNEVILNNALL